MLEKTKNKQTKTHLTFAKFAKKEMQLFLTHSQSVHKNDSVHKTIFKDTVSVKRIKGENFANHSLGIFQRNRLF